jgi:aminopeptidase N
VAGTPVLDCSGSFEKDKFTLKVKQSMNPPFHIPFAVKIGDREKVLSLKQAEEKFVFEVKKKPVPSLLRRFSASVILNYPYTDEELLHLMAHDDDPFNRWEAAQRLASAIILGSKGIPSPAFLQAAKNVLADPDPAFAAEVLALPSETFLAEQMKVVDPDALHQARNALRKELAKALAGEFASKYQALHRGGPYSPDAASAGRRALKNLCLGYLSEVGMRALCDEQFRKADNMTDAMAALTALSNLDCPERLPALEDFYARWKDEPLVVDKWLAVQAGSRLPGTLARVRELLAHPAFDIKVPNKVYALIRTFSANHVRFHAASGEGYSFLADQVLALNRLNPQVAARMARGFDRWKRFDPARQQKARAALERIRDADGLSKDVAEIVTKALTP